MQSVRWRTICVPLFAGMLGACGGGGEGGGATCTPAPRITSAPVASATVGEQYRYHVTATLACIPFFSCGNLEAVRLPPGAGIDPIRAAVFWTPSASDANTTVPFTIAAGPDLCGNRATQSWSVSVYAAPEIHSFTAANGTVPRGGSAVLTGVFSGSGSIDQLGFVSVTSGVPVTTPPLSVTSQFTLRVFNQAGRSVSQTVFVSVPSPPAISSFTASPQLIAQGSSSTLSWSRSGDFTRATLDPGGTDVRNANGLVVTPQASTTYTLTLEDDFGASASASLQVEVAPMPQITSFTAFPVSTVFGGTVTLTADFQGTGRIDRLDGLPSTLGPVVPGGSLDTPALKRRSGFRLVVRDVFGREVSRDVFVDIAGPGTFAPSAGAPLRERRRHTATLLSDGRVLIAGGIGDNTTELYDPATDSFSAGPQMLSARQTHSAVLLRDGRVLIMSGAFPNTVKDEIYNPAGGTITPTSWDGVFFGQAFRLPDDRIYLGNAGGGFLIDAAGTTRGPLLSASNVAHAGCLDAVARLADGRILGVFGAPTPSVLFLPATDSYALTGAAARNRGCGFRATPAGDGRVLVTGGDIFPGPQAEIYDPVAGTFSDVGNQVNFSSFGTGTTLADGRILLVGGDNPSAEVFDPSTQSFRETGGMRAFRRDHAATLLQDDRVLVTGGCSLLPCPAEIYTPQ